MIKRIALLALALALTVACAANPYKKAVLATEINEGGTYTAGHDIRPGTWVFANSHEHAPGLPCFWSVIKKATDGTEVTLNSPDDTDRKIQKMYVGSGEILKINFCGPGAWSTFDNESGEIR